MPLLFSVRRGKIKKPNYLRISVTDKCNLRCRYCLPKSGIKLLPREEILNFREIEDFVRVAVSWGIDAVRITGGEPLLRRNLLFLVSNLSRIAGLKDLSLTTNGVLLARYAQDLKDAGLNRVNVSLDTLKKERFKEITGSDDLEKVVEGINAAGEAGLTPVKINKVVIAGLNDDETFDFIEFAKSSDIIVRFIEHFPSTSGEEDLSGVSHAEIRKVLERKYGSLREVSIDMGEGPASYFCVSPLDVTVGFISSNDGVCSACNRLRLTADGQLFSCLYARSSADVKTALRPEAKLEKIKDILDAAWKNKSLLKKGSPLARECIPMFMMGG